MDYLTIQQAAELLGVTEDSARKQLSRWGVAGVTHYPADAVQAAQAARPQRGNWRPSLNADLYELHQAGDRHWWTCNACDTRSGTYSTKPAARRAAERHHDNGKCTRQHL